MHSPMKATLPLRRVASMQSRCAWALPEQSSAQSTPRPAVNLRICFDDRLVARVKHELGAHLPGTFGPIGHWFDHDHPCAAEARVGHRAQSHRPGPAIRIVVKAPTPINCMAP